MSPWCRKYGEDELSSTDTDRVWDRDCSSEAMIQVINQMQKEKKTDLLFEEKELQSIAEEKSNETIAEEDVGSKLWYHNKNDD